MVKKLLTLVFLALTVGLALLAPRLSRKPEYTRSALRITRVWAVECDPAVTAWLRKRAAAFEKAGGARIYLRSATSAEARAAQTGQSGVVAPDLLVQPGEGEPLAILGYALIVRDETAAAVTPAPTSALFYRPSPQPAPSASPAPTPAPGILSAILLPDGLPATLEGAQVSRDPAGDFSAGKAPAALLTAGQATALSVGYRAYALPGGEGVRIFGAQSLSLDGRAFLDALKTETAQRALSAHGLYTVLPGLRLYDPSADPLRALIETALP